VQSVYQKLEVNATAIVLGDGWVNLLSASITTTAGIKIDVQSSFSASNDASANNFFRLVVTPMSTGIPTILQGSGNTCIGVGDDPGTETGAIDEEISTTPDTYTVTLQWSTSAGTARCRPVTFPDSEHADILVQELTA